ncbi:MAG: response regulator [Leptospiraceae bacterium]|nr:response regulator [Leptospiraceae bacterium]
MNKTILIVEDNDINANLLKFTLKKEGFNTNVCFNGESAVELVFSEPGAIDLILMDIELGEGIDGVEAAGKILSEHNIPLLFLSSHVEKDVVKRTESLPSFGYVVKNSGNVVLLTSIKMALRLHEANLEIESKNKELEQTLAKIEFYNRKLIESEHDIKNILEISNDIFLKTDKNGEIINYHEGKYSIVNISSKQNTAKNLIDLFLLEISNELIRLSNLSLKENKITKYEFSQIINTDYKFFEANIIPAEQDQILIIIHEITEIKNAQLEIQKLNSLYSFVLEINHLIFHTKNIEKLLFESCKLAVEHNNFEFAWLGLTNFENNKIEKRIIYPDYKDFTLTSIDLQSNENTSKELIKGNTIISYNHSKPHIILPIKEKDQLIGTFIFSLNELRNFTESEIKLLEEFAGDVSFAIESINIEKSNISIKQELLESRTFLANLISNLPGFVYRVRNNKEYTPLFISDNIIDIIGFTKDEFLNLKKESPLLMMYPEDSDSVWKERFSQLNKKLPFEIEYRIINKRNEIIWVWERGYGIYNNDGNLLYIEGFISEITSRKQHEEKILENELKLNTILETILDSVLIVNEKSKIQIANKATERIFGYTQEELIENDISILMPEPYSNLHHNYIDRYLITGEKKIIGTGRELKGKRKNGEVFDCEISVFDWTFKGHKYFTGTIKDISYRKKVEEQLRQSQKMEAVGKISGGVAHDFNNILAIILGNLELLENKIPGKDEKIQKKFKKVYDAIDRGVGLTRKLLSFARKTSFDVVPVDVNETIYGIKELFERVLSKNIEIKLELSKEKLVAKLDKNELENVLLNLAINSRDAIVDNGKIKIKTGKFIKENYNSQGTPIKEPWLYISFYDNGSGIPKEVIEKIFDPFFTTKPKGKGTGLGLSQAYSFVEQSGGTINVNSKSGEFTEFKIYLPLTSISEQTSTLEEPQLSENIYEIKGNVLIVDDESNMIEIIKSILQPLKLDIKSANNAKEAQNLIEKNNFDLVISDIIMPGKLNGIQLAEWINKHHSNLKIILISGFHEEKNLDLEKLNNVPILEKPFQSKTLEKIVIQELIKNED